MSDLADVVRRLLSAVRSQPPNLPAIIERCHDLIGRKKRSGLLTNPENPALPAPEATARQRDLLAKARHPGPFWFVEYAPNAAELLTAVLAEVDLPWSGDDWDELDPLPKRLLIYMRDKVRANLGDVCEAVWGRDESEVTDSAISTAVSKATHFLQKRGEARTLHKGRGKSAIYWD